MTKRQVKQPEVGVLLGSDSDWPLIEDAVKTLHEFDVAFEVRVISAHRTPEQAAVYAQSAARRGLKVMIAAAGGAAHLAGVVAAHTNLPVIGIPVKGGALDGLDALLSTVQMPGGIPVATVALGRAGAINAALLAIQILALCNEDLNRKLEQHKKSLKDKVAKGNHRVQVELEKLLR